MKMQRTAEQIDASTQTQLLCTFLGHAQNASTYAAMQQRSLQAMPSRPLTASSWNSSGDRPVEKTSRESAANSDSHRRLKASSLSWVPSLWST
jgi:hypothetical protein